MREERLACPRCGKRMDEGFILGKGVSDRGYGLTTSWVEGRPQRSFWTGLKLKGRRVLATSTYRCTGCGYLETYARGR